MPDLESTYQLLERARQGDRDALDRLFARSLPPLVRWAAGRLPRWARDLTDTHDLVQDTLLKTFKRIESFEPRGVGSLQNYLRHAVLNRIRDELRRFGRQRHGSAVELDSAVPDRSPSPLEEAIGSESLERYERALARLKPAEQEAIVARIELGYSNQELADALGKPTPEAARKAVERAIVRLATEMTRESGEA